MEEECAPDDGISGDGGSVEGVYESAAVESRLAVDGSDESGLCALVWVE